jgi:hypothetical protein
LDDGERRENSTRACERRRRVLTQTNGSREYPTQSCNATDDAIRHSNCQHHQAVNHSTPFGAVPQVKTRAVGALHNMSSDAETIRIIRREQGIAPLIALLSDRCDAVCGSAAGALQNVSREVRPLHLAKL